MNPDLAAFEASFAIWWASLPAEVTADADKLMAEIAYSAGALDMIKRLPELTK